ncbi:MAG TPA: ABC transporter permease [Phnomibacter sp.]|nr:ABC transporter permease [Phnomibacter sp.]
MSNKIIIEPGRNTRTYVSDLWRYRDLVGLFVHRDFTARYKQTLLGPLWHFIQPILSTIVSFLLFNVVAGIGTNGVNPVLFQMSGIIIWGYFAACFTSTSSTFISNAGIFGKVYFPRLVSPISVVISQLVQFGIQLFLLLSTMCFFAFRGQAFPINGSWLLIPVLLLIMAGMGLGLGIIISSLTTKYRDLTVLIGFGVQLLMFGSAVNYPLSALEPLAKNHGWILQLIHYNPVAVVIEIFRNAMLHIPQPHLLQSLLYSIAWTIGLLAIGMRMFGRVEKTFMDTV